jgi:hypothetical protein
MTEFRWEEPPAGWHFGLWTMGRSTRLAIELSRIEVRVHTRTWGPHEPVYCTACPDDPYELCPVFREALGILMRSIEPPPHPADQIVV